MPTLTTPISWTYASVTWTARELFAGVQATETTAGLTYNRAYQIDASTNGLHPSIVVSAVRSLVVSGTQTFSGRIPVRRDTEGGYYCQTVRVTPVDSDDRTWDYVAEFGLNELSASPLDDPAEVEWGGIETSEAYDYDVDGKAAVNTARKRLDPLPERDSGEDTVTITANYSTWNPAVGSQFSNSVNSNAMWGSAVAAGQAKLGRITARKVKEEGYTFWKVTFPIRFRQAGWDQTFLNLGYDFISNVSSGTITYTAITSIDRATGASVPIQEPVLISADGSSQYTGSLTGTNVPTITLRPYRRRDWSTLDIPSPF